MAGTCSSRICGRCGKPIYNGGKRRWHDECETEKERTRRLGRLAARRAREQTPENSRAGRQLTCACGRCGKTFVTKAGRQRRFAKDCPNRERERVRLSLERRQLAADLSEPLPDGVPFDRLRRVPESPCLCGTNCGLTFRKVIGQRGRKYHPDCPGAAELRKRKLAEHYARQAAKTKAEAPKRNATSRGADLTPHRKTKICKKCCNLPHERPATGCPACLLPYAPDTYKTASGRTIEIAP